MNKHTGMADRGGRGPNAVPCDVLYYYYSYFGFSNMVRGRGRTSSSHTKNVMYSKKLKYFFQYIFVQDFRIKKYRILHVLIYHPIFG